MTVVQRIGEPSDQFPVGMRVLAVDDDPICLRLLEHLLRKCQYHVTATSSSLQALTMLRENKDRFDLVISDVQMPDMDGFKLLELVGLEMDLPVIMLSANGDTKLVMKGITHGACDYLLKPVRMEELQNIWQHVVRKKKVDPQDLGNSQDRRTGPISEGQGSSGLGNLEQDGKIGKKRKDQYEEHDEENDDDDDEQDNEDSSSQKKPRVVWSVELHRKFVAAVDQLGLDKAVPKKILELMNVEKLTRENVASHLQKYRLYLKRISAVANQQANMVAALGGADPSYLRMNAVNFNHFNNQYPNNALRTLPTAGMLGRLNSPSGLGIHGLSAPGPVTLGHGHIPRNTVNDYKFQSPMLPGEQTGNILQGMPTSLELPAPNDNPRMFPLSTGFADPKVTSLSTSTNSFSGLQNSSLLYQGHAQESQSQGAFGNQSLAVASLPDLSRCNGNWRGAAVQSPTLPLNGYQSAATHSTSVLNRSGSNELNGVSGSIQMSIPLAGSNTEAQCQPALVGNTMNMGFASKQVWDDHHGLSAANHSDYNPSLSVAQGGFPSLAGAVADPKSGLSNRIAAGFGLTGHSNYDNLGAFQHHGDENSALGGFPAGSAGSLEDVVGMIKREPESAALKSW